MDQPLTKWYCDVCRETIEDVKNGLVIWKTTNESKSHGFKIVHQGKCDQKDYFYSDHLENFLGDDGMGVLLSTLSLGPIKNLLYKDVHCAANDIDEFVDFMRRVQTPFYEEARRHFKNQDLLEEYSDSNQVTPYQPEELENIVEKYGADR